MTRQQVAEAMDVSLVTVHKWLSNGNMKDQVAQRFASHILCDWLWLKHGVCRIPDEMTQQLSGFCDNAAVVKFRREKWYIDQMGGSLRHSFGRIHDDDIVDVDTESLCLPDFWNPWAYWAEEAFSSLDKSGAPIFDGSGAMINAQEQIITERMAFKLVTIWTDSQGETRGVLMRLPSAEDANVKGGKPLLTDS